MKRAKITIKDLLKEGKGLPKIAKTIPETILGILFSAAFREFLLSFLTLINFDGDAEPKKPENYKKVKKFAKPFAEGAIILLAVLVGSRATYFWPNKKATTERKVKFAFEYTLMPMVGTFGGAAIGWLLGGLLSEKTFYTKYWKDKKGIILLALSAPFTYASWKDKFREGKTENGEIGLEITRKREADEFKEVRLPGFPEKIGCYLLPALSKRQGSLLLPGSNLNFWKNNYNDQLIYAFDFLLGYRSEVLAMRGGTVVTFKDIQLEDSEDPYNYLVYSAQ